MTPFKQSPYKKEWNCCHPSGYAGRVIESYHDKDYKTLGSRAFIFNEQYHRDWSAGPAFESFYEDGTLRYQRYLNMGKLHRPASVGPAFIYFKDPVVQSFPSIFGDGSYFDGHSSGSEYWEDGVKLSTS